MIDQISVNELRAAMATRAPRVIDVRERHEFIGGHLPGAEWIPMALIPLRRDELRSPEPVYIVCQSGGRSGQVVSYLANQGIPAVSVTGGTGTWQHAGFPLESGGRSGRP